MTSNSLILGLVALATFAQAGHLPAMAQNVAVGNAVVAVNIVTGRTTAETRTISEGAFVYRNEVVATSRDSKARLALSDNTNISLGPNAMVRLDRFAAVGNGSASQVVVSATRGVLRFVSGNSGSRAYEIRTPLATIGVRGTTFDVSVAPGVTQVQLREGAIIVCPTGRACVSVTRPGDLVTIRSGGAIAGPAAAPSSGMFQRYCDRRICAISAGVAPRDPARGNDGRDGRDSAGGPSGASSGSSGGNSSGGNSSGGGSAGGVNSAGGNGSGGKN